jgi:hypothetical protein
MKQLKLSNGQTYTFADDVSMKALHDLGVEPTQSDSKDMILEYNKRKIVAFSFEPKLTIESVNDLNSLDFMLIIKEVLLTYQDRLKLFFSMAPQPLPVEKKITTSSLPLP